LRAEKVALSFGEPESIEPLEVVDEDDDSNFRNTA
jgi:hypothetical protein